MMKNQSETHFFAFDLNKFTATMVDRASGD